MGSIRRSRTRRPEKRGYEPTLRDHDILRAVGRFMYASTENLTELFFGNTSTCSRRLAKLLSLRLLAVRVPRRDGPNVYRLTKRGLDHLTDAGVDPDDLHLGGREQHDDLFHTLLGNELRVRLVTAVRTQSDVTIEQLHSDADLRRVAEMRGRDPTYIPDLLIRLMTATGPVGLVVEADTGTESVKYFLRHKVRELAQLRALDRPVWGLLPWRPLVLVPTERRLRALAPGIVEAGEGRVWLGTTVEVLRVRPVLGPAFATFDAIDATRKGDPIPFERSLFDRLPPRVP